MAFGDLQAENAAKSLYAKGQNAISASVNAAGAGLGAALAAQGQVAGIVSQVNADADTLKASAAPMRQDAATQRGYAKTFEGMSATATESAKPWLALGSDIATLNADATGIGGEWVKNYNALSPDSLVSFAASDAQKSIDNTRGQMARTLTRSGVSSSSPAYIAALAEAKKYEQALLSGVKTRAHLLGLKEQSSALQAGLQMALQSTGLGQAYEKMALDAIGSASSATGAATTAETQAANVIAGAGTLRASTAGAVSSSANAVASATASLSNAQRNAAEYYTTQSGSILGALQSGADTAISALFS
jgi:hypothetical protein